MKPVFIYIPTTDLATATQFYRETLGLEETWREGDDTVAFAFPESNLQLMVTTSPGGPGPMYLVPSAAQWLVEHPSVEVSVPILEIPGGAVVGLRDPSGNEFYVFDQR
ncbi:MAG: VOC family protein [Mycetocola sp.]